MNSSEAHSKQESDQETLEEGPPSQELFEIESQGDSFLFQIKEFLSRGEKEEARELISKKDTQGIKSWDFHFQLGNLCYELDLLHNCLLEWNLAIRDNSYRPEPYLSLAELHEDNGNLEKGIRCWTRLISLQPENAEYYKRSAHLYEMLNQIGKAEAVLKQGLEKTQDSSLDGLLLSLKNIGKSPESEKETEDSPWIPRDSDLAAFTSLFSGREGVYARQWASPTGETGYVPIREPLTLQVARNHILGNHTIGIYQLRLDETVRFVAYDLDLPKYLLKDQTYSKTWKNALQKTQSAACLFLDKGAAYHIPVYLEDSGYKGRHCWIFFKQPIPARMARKFAVLFASGLANFPADVNLEIFPKQTRVKDDGLGNLIKLPLGIHRKTGNRSTFLNPDGTPCSHPFSYLSEIVQLDKESILSFIDQVRGDGKTPESLESEGSDVESLLGTENERKVPQKIILHSTPQEYLPEKDEKLQFLFSKCETLRRLFEKLKQEHQISHDEYLVLVHTLGHLEEGPQAVNWILKQCYNAQPDQFLKSRLRGNPMSCPKIRSKIPSITSLSTCTCQFSETQGAYPHPLLFLLSYSNIGKIPIESLEFQNLLLEYLKLKKQVQELTGVLSDYEKKVESFYSQAGVEAISTPWGVLERQIVDGKPFYILKL